MTQANQALVDAIKLAMEAEKKAAALYADAGTRTENPLAKRLFNKLTEFESYHYKKLSDLVRSLTDSQTFIEYTAQSLPGAAEGEVDEIPEPNKMSMMSIIAMGQEVELGARQKYTDLAAQSDDPDGKAMFEQLAQEEDAHYRLLRNVYWNLNDRGVWSWPKDR